MRLPSPGLGCRLSHGRVPYSLDRFTSNNLLIVKNTQNLVSEGKVTRKIVRSVIRASSFGLGTDNQRPGMDIYACLPTEGFKNTQTNLTLCYPCDGDPNELSQRIPGRIPSMSAFTLRKHLANPFQEAGQSERLRQRAKERRRQLRQELLEERVMLFVSPVHHEITGSALKFLSAPVIPQIQQANTEQLSLRNNDRDGDSLVAMAQALHHPSNSR